MVRNRLQAGDDSQPAGEVTVPAPWELPLPIPPQPEGEDEEEEEETRPVRPEGPH